MPIDDATGGGFQVVVADMETGEVDPEAQQQAEQQQLLQETEMARNAARFCKTK